MTKPIILVKICYELLYVIQGVENSFGKITSWPQLISKLLVGCTYLFAMLLLIGLALFYTPGVLFSISLLFVNKYYYFVEAYKQMLLGSLILKNSSP